MISLKDRIYYTDPLVDHTVAEGTTRFLVIRERYPRTFNSPLGQVITIGPDAEATLADGVLFRSHNGIYVDCQPVSPRNAPTYNDRMGILSDEAFVIGHMTGLDRDSGAGTFRDIVRSDATTLPDGMIQRVTDHVPAAPWARALMPAVGESQAATDAKVALAQKKYRMRFAQIEIMREAEERNWQEDLQELRGSADTPILTGRWAAHVTARALLGGNQLQAAEIPSELDETVAALRSRSLSRSVGAWAKIEVPVSFIAPATTNDTDEAAISRDILVHHARNFLGSRNIDLGQYNVNRLLRAAS